MSKSGVFEGHPGMVAKATALKKELQKMANAIFYEEDINSDAIYRTQQILVALEALKSKKSIPLKLDHTVAVPEEFKCPISRKLMKDPVIISTGQTYDKPFITRHLTLGNRMCPKTQHAILHKILVPNNLIREMISSWCKNHGIEMPKSAAQHSNYDGYTKSGQDHFITLLGKMSKKWVATQNEASKELRKLTKYVPSFRVLFVEYPNAIPQLLFPFTKKTSNKIQSALQRNIITTLLNISAPDENKKRVAEEPMVIRLLIEALTTGTIITICSGAAALFSLSVLDSNKELIGRNGALQPLIDLLDDGPPVVLKDVASAIMGLCINKENCKRAVVAGAVRVILKKVARRMLVDELLAILALLSSIERAVVEMVAIEAVPWFLCFLREKASDRSKGNCIAILYNICYNDHLKLKEIWEEESSYHTISQLAQNGTSIARTKASGILEALKWGDTMGLYC